MADEKNLSTEMAKAAAPLREMQFELQLSNDGLHMTTMYSFVDRARRNMPVGSLFVVHEGDSQNKETWRQAMQGLCYEIVEAPYASPADAKFTVEGGGREYCFKSRDDEFFQIQIKADLSAPAEFFDEMERYFVPSLLKALNEPSAQLVPDALAEPQKVAWKSHTKSVGEGGDPYGPLREMGRRAGF